MCHAPSQASDRLDGIWDNSRRELSRSAFRATRLPYAGVLQSFDPAARHERQMQEIDQHNQLLLRESPFVRRDYINMSWDRYDKKDGGNKLDTSSVANYAKCIERYREDFREDVIGRFDMEPVDANPLTRKIGESEYKHSFRSMSFAPRDII